METGFICIILQQYIHYILITNLEIKKNPTEVYCTKCKGLSLFLFHKEGGIGFESVGIISTELVIELSKNFSKTTEESPETLIAKALSLPLLRVLL